MASATLHILVLFTLASSILAEFGFLLLHTNDMHAHFQQTDKHLGECKSTSTNCYGGFARIRSQVQKSRKEAAAKGLPTVFLNAGDNYQGTPFYTFFKWPLVAKLIEFLGIDAMCLGNHEFDDGVKGLAPYINNVSVPIVSCNLDISQEPSMNSTNLTPSYILNVGNNKVGIIGYLTPDTKMLSNVGKVEILEEIPSIRSEAKILLAQNVSILIALGHSGYNVDQEIARQVEEIDIVIGGHTDTFLYTGTPPDVDKPEGPYPTIVTQASGKQVPVVQAFCRTKYLGYLEVTFDDDGNLKNYSGSPILLSGDLPQDTEVLEVFKPYESETSARLMQVVGYTSVLLDNIDKKCNKEECNIGNLITDASVDYVSRHLNHSGSWSKAVLGLVLGGRRESIDTERNIYHNGSITLGDVIKVIRWGGKVIVVNVTGDTLLQTLEHSISKYDKNLSKYPNTFLQVSGLNVTYNVTRPPGKRVVNVEVLCSDCDVHNYQPLQTTSIYGLVIYQYVFEGGDGFKMFRNIQDYIVLDDVDYVVVAQYLEHHSPVNPSIEGRITIHS